MSLIQQSDNVRHPFLTAAIVVLGTAPSHADFAWTERADLLGHRVGRGHHGGGVIANRVYLAGGGFQGQSDWDSYTSAEVYDPMTDTWQALPSMSLKRTAPAYAVADFMGSPRLYIIGGMDTSAWPFFVLHENTEEFDPLGNSWRIVGTPMPSGYWSGNMCAVTVDNLIYIMGGHDDIFSTFTDRLAAYDPDTDSYTVLASMPVKVSSGACAAVDRRIYWFGGYDQNAGYGGTPILSTFIYDIDADSWSTASSTAPRRRVDAAAISDSTNIHVIGGWTGTPGYTNYYDHIDTYDTLADSWTPDQLESIQCPGDDGANVRGRTGLTLHWANDGSSIKLFAMGGSVGFSVPTTCNESSPPPGAACSPSPYDLSINSLRMVKGGACPPGDVQVEWSTVDPSVTTDVYNFHEMNGKFDYIIDRTIYATPPANREPMGNTPILERASPPTLCATPTFVPGDGLTVYGIWQADDCTGQSITDMP